MAACGRLGLHGHGLAGCRKHHDEGCAKDEKPQCRVSGSRSGRALGVQLGGGGFYFGQLVENPARDPINRITLQTYGRMIVLCI